MLGLNVTLVGVTVVFLALIILAFILSLFSRIFSPIKNKDTITHENENSVEVLEQEANNDHENASDDELIAVLTAAVMASLNNNPDFKIRVKSFRRIPQNTPVWNMHGRKEYLNEKLL